MVGIGRDSHRKTECRDSTGEQRPASGSCYYIYYTVRWNEIQWNGKLRQKNKRIGTTAVSVIPKGSMESINFLGGPIGVTSDRYEYEKALCVQV